MFKPLRALTLSILTLAMGCAATAPSPNAGPPGHGPAPGEPLPCTSMGCYSGFQVALQSDSWPAGKYRISVTADDKTVSCEGNLPLLGCDQGTSLKCDGAGVMIGESGCALPAEQHSFSELQLESTPKNVSISVEYNGELVDKADFTPEYKVTRPNGPTCEPVCTQASDTMQLRLKP